jgi:hypothetical protein
MNNGMPNETKYLKKKEENNQVRRLSIKMTSLFKYFLHFSFTRGI